MKLHCSIAFAAMMLTAAPVAAQPPDTVGWGTTFANQVYRFTFPGYGSVPGTLSQVSIGADGDVWGVDPNYTVLRWTGSQWQQVPGKQLQQISVRNAQEVWGVDTANNLFRWNGSAWQEPQPSKLIYVSVGGDGTLVGINDASDVFRLDGSTWTKFGDQKLKRVSVTNAQTIVGIGIDDKLYRWAGTRWELVGYVSLLDAVQTADGTLWRINSVSGNPPPGIFSGAVQWANPANNTIGNIAAPILRQIAVVSGVSPGGQLTPEQRQALEAHNRERQNYAGVGPLQWSPELAQYAQQWTDTIASQRPQWQNSPPPHRPNNARDNPFKPNEPLGENLHGNSAATTLPNAVQSWINEKQWYHYDQDNGMGASGQPPGCTAPWPQSCGHFTQVIWKNTQLVGCGKATAADGATYIACNYYPAGNWQGQKPY
jgi:pathogenesis-related protein 1